VPNLKETLRRKMRGFLVYDRFSEKLSPPGPMVLSANQRMAEQAGAKSYQTAVHLTIGCFLVLQGFLLLIFLI